MPRLVVSKATGTEETVGSHSQLLVVRDSVYSVMEPERGFGLRGAKGYERKSGLALGQEPTAVALQNLASQVGSRFPSSTRNHYQESCLVLVVLYHACKVGYIHT